MNLFTDVHYSGRNFHSTAAPVYQYDRGRQLRIYGLDQTAEVQVQYSILGMQKTLTDVAEYTDSVFLSNVPNVLLAQTAEIQAYIYVSENNSAQTIIHISIPITARTKPEGYQYTETELKGLEYVLAQLNDAIRTVNTATTNANNATQAAQGVVNAVKPFSKVSATVTPVDPDVTPSVKLTQTDSSTQFAFSIPQGTQGKDGDPGVYVGAQQPDDPTVNVWVNTSENPKTFAEAISEHLESQYIHTIRCTHLDGTTSSFEVYGVVK